MSIDRPRVRAISPGDQVPQRRARRCPKAKGAVDVKPRAGFVSDVGDLLERIDRARVHVAGLSTNYPRSIMARERVAKGDRHHPTLRVGRHRHDARGAEPEQP